MQAPFVADARHGNGPWPTYAFVIPFFNARATILPLLDSIARQDRTLGFEVCCCDDASTDESPALVAAHPAGVHLLRLTRNSGPSVARNLAARTSTADHLVFLDADVVLEDDTLVRIDAFRRAHPEAGAFHWPMSNRSLVPGIVGLFKTLLDRHMTRTPGGVRRVSFMSARGGLIRRALFFETGGFDPRYRRADIEDWELSRRLAPRCQILHTDEFAIHHRQSPSFPRNFGNYFRRAFLFTRLFARNRHLDNYTETTPGNSLATLLTLPAVLALALALASWAAGQPLWAGRLAVAGGLALVPFALANASFLAFTVRSTGWRAVALVPAFVALRLAFNLAAALGVVSAVALWPLGGWPYERRVAPEEDPR